MQLTGVVRIKDAENYLYEIYLKLLKADFNVLSEITLSGKITVMYLLAVLEKPVQEDLRFMVEI